ncbi:MAG: formylglycine-generating enzyme family protein [Deltaproteobacteria bacterium]|nr:formylglycine-generating enzyme family protein [Deltaproteobacteria bacterium]
MRASLPFLLGLTALAACGDPTPVDNGCGGLTELEGVPGGACGCDGTWSCDGSEALVCDDVTANACGGCGPLDGSVGDSCGECGQLACSEGALACLDEGFNECGGCATLEGPVGGSCGECGGTWACQGVDALVCDGGANDCGGCEPLAGVVGDSCGTACGIYACDGPNELFCDESVAPNACGGCGSLSGAPGDSCGMCGRLECDGTDTLVCVETCTMIGAACTAGTCGPDLECTAGRCAPPGLAFVPADSFTMGAPTDERGFHSGRENGQHTVTLTHDLLVQRTTVTQGEYAVVTGARPAYFANCGDECPVERVSWWEMLLYANALSRAEGLTECYQDLGVCTGVEGEGCDPGDDHCAGFTCANDDPTFDLSCDGYRLPTESEWEYFARAGTMTAFLTASGSLQEWGATPVDPELGLIAWYGANSGVSYAGGLPCDYDPTATTCGPHPVAQKAPNAWGLFDMTGNVWERVWDRSGDYPAPGSVVVDPLGPDATAGRPRRMRGGPFNAWGQYMRVAYRTGPGPEQRYYNVGFRLVRSIP